MNICEVKEVGTLELGNKVDITDPCYDKDVWCRITTECKPGVYTGYAEVSDEGEWGKRVATLSIYLNNVESETNFYLGNIGVDAGLAGFFNNKRDFNDKEWIEFCNSLGNHKEMAWNNYDGIFSSSGFGDGGYDVYTNADRSAFKIEFIEEEEEEDWDWD